MTKPATTALARATTCKLAAAADAIATHPKVCATVNKALAARGFSEKLVRDRSGYFYFTEGNAAEWRRCSVYVYRISDLTVEQWLAEHADCRAA